MKAKILVLGAVLALAACDNDPSKGKTKATTGEAQPTSAEAKNAATAVTYTFDGSNSKLEWVGAKVTRKHDGGYKQFKGDVKLVDNDPTKSSVNVEIDIDSMFTDDDKLLGHLKSPDFFDVEKFPKAKFESTKIEKSGDKYQVTGNLTMHGVTKSITFPATIQTKPDGVDTQAEFVINRKDFGIVYPGMANDLIKDDVAIKLDIHAKKAA